jgi:hypothetical protein
VLNDGTKFRAMIFPARRISRQKKDNLRQRFKEVTLFEKVSLLS